MAWHGMRLGRWGTARYQQRRPNATKNTKLNRSTGGAAGGGGGLTRDTAGMALGRGKRDHLAPPPPCAFCSGFLSTCMLLVVNFRGYAPSYGRLLGQKG